MCAQVLEWKTDRYGNPMARYRNGEIVQSGGKYRASYECLMGGGRPYQAQAGYCDTESGAMAAIDEAIARQDAYMARFDAISYEEAFALGWTGVRWPRPFAPDEVLTVVYKADRYLLSVRERYPRCICLSMGAADCSDAFILPEGMEIDRAVRAWVKWFESPVKQSKSCHYCGAPMRSLGFFGEPVCAECGG